MESKSNVISNTNAKTSVSKSQERETLPVGRKTPIPEPTEQDVDLKDLALDWFQETEKRQKLLEDRLQLDKQLVKNKKSMLEDMEVMGENKLNFQVDSSSEDSDDSEEGSSSEGDEKTSRNKKKLKVKAVPQESRSKVGTKMIYKALALELGEEAEKRIKQRVRSMRKAQRQKVGKKHVLVPVIPGSKRKRRTNDLNSEEKIAKRVNREIQKLHEKVKKQ
jgi:hypothetical protein